MSAKYMSSQELCNAIYGVVLGNPKPLNRRQIADLIGKKKSPHIIRMMEQLVDSGWLKKESAVDKFGRVGWVYSVGRRGDEACENVA